MTEALLKIQTTKSGRTEFGHPIGELESLTLRSEDNREEFPTATLVVATNKKATMIIIPVSTPGWAQARGPRGYGVCRDLIYDYIFYVEHSKIQMEARIFCLHAGRVIPNTVRVTRFVSLDLHVQ